MGPDTRMGRPEPQLLSSRGGAIPQPRTLGASEPANPDAGYGESYGATPPPPRSGSNRQNPYVTSIEPFDMAEDTSPGMEDAEDYPPITPMDTDLEEDTLPSVPETSPALSHKVQRGESLWSISRAYGVSLSELAAYNNMQKDDLLLEGRVLEIPPGGTAPADAGTMAPPRQDDRQTDGGATRPTAPSTATTSVTPSGSETIPDSGQYIVKSGDSLWKISRRFGVSIDNLRQWNALDSDTLQIGRVLLLRPPESIGAGVDGDMQPPRGARVEPTGMPGFGTGADDDTEPAAADADMGTANPDEGTGADVRTAPVNFPQTLEHTVSRGETLQDIATMYETSIQAIRQANPGVRSDADLDPGKQLVIPFE